MRNHRSGTAPPAAVAVGAGASTSSLAYHPAPSVSPLDLPDLASPHKRQRNVSPDHRQPAPSPASTLRPEPGSYFAYPLPPVVEPTPLSSSTTTSCPPRSILCTPSSPSSACSSPFASPPCSRPLSRRSSTSKSVRFARCTNASVFPTHSTAEYDRSPIVPTCGNQSLELKRNDDDDDGGWVQCHVREKKEGEAASQTRCVPQLPKYSPAMENPVEGVHGLIEGGFFVGDSAERDGAHPAFEAASVIAEDDELEFEDEGMVVDDSTESASDEAHLGPVPRLVRTGSLSDDDSSAEDMPASSSPELPDTYGEPQPRIRHGSASSDGDEPADEKERRKAECRKKFGLCALGKWSRSEIFGATDSLGGF
ncbi:hypothetical protein JCM10213_000617 [Rhodosporidiobolus nylandii]